MLAFRRVGVVGLLLGIGAAGLLSLPQSQVPAAPVKDRDPLLVGSKWKGKLTQKGTFTGGVSGPNAFEILLTVTERDGTSFAADLNEQAPSIAITYLVKGRIYAEKDKTYSVTFKSVGSKDTFGTSPVLGVPYKGILCGTTLQGTWQLRNRSEGADVAGDFSIKCQK